ncbi:MAG: ABC transporter substrate-binding protein, partial [Aquihabitans sp.]
PDLKTGSNALGLVLKEQMGGTDHSVAFIGEDNDSAKNGLTLLSASVESEGFDVVMSDSSLPAPPDVLGDVSPFVANILKADDGGQPDVVYIIATTTGTTIAKALQDAGYEGMIVTPSFSPILLSFPGYDGSWVNTQMGMDPEIPANAAMLESIAAVDPDMKLNLAVVAGYWATDFFIKALEETGQDLTVETLLATLNGGFTYEVDGVVGPSVWPENHEVAVPCAALTEVVDGEFVPRVPLLCGENITVD